MSSEKFNYHQLIEEYLLDMMTTAERSSFEKEMESNPELQREVNAHRLANDIVIERRLMDVKATLKAIDQKSFSNMWKWVIGGGIGLALLAGFLFLPTDKTVSVATLDQPKMAISPELSPRHKEETVVETQPKRSVEVKGTAPSKPSTALPETQKQLTLEPTTLPAVIASTPTAEASKAELPVEIDKPETKPIPVPVDPCKWVTLSADISATPTCHGKSEGLVRISRIKGGTLPYKTTLLDEKNQEVTTTSLSKGVYAIVITDAKGCSQRFEKISIGSKACSENIVFNPTLGETWEIPSSEQDGVLKVYDNAGSLYFWKEIQAFDKEHWSGRASNGEQKQGYFLYEIQYKDGSSAQGSITLVK